MSSARRRTTRSISYAPSDISEPVETASSVKSERRRRKKPDKPTATIAKETYSYGTEISSAHSQRLAAQSAMMKPVRSIETGVEQATRDAAEGYARDLSAIPEEEQRRGENVGRDQVGGDLRENRGDRSDSELTGIKTFGREDGDSLDHQSRRQSRAPSIDRDLYGQSNSYSSIWDSTRDSIRGSIPGIFKSAGWLLLLVFAIAAIAISLYFIARWFPNMKNPQGSGYNASSLAGSERSPLAGSERSPFAESERSPLAAFEVERLGRRLDDLEDQFRKLPRTSETAARPILRQVNWLSYDLGARAIPYLSSPSEYFRKEIAKGEPIRTLLKPRWWDCWGARFESYEVVEGEPNRQVKFEKIDYGPNSALQPWREHEPRYCAPGKLQLAVKLPRAVTPLNIVIEYYLKDEVLAVGAAPKEVELWIPIPDDAARAAVVLAVSELYPDILAGERSEIARFLEQKQALDSDWVPVGRWTYDIYANKVAQKFHVPVDLEYHSIAVDEIVVRVNSNWANKDVTCLVRAHMHGIDQSGIHEQLDTRRDGSGGI